MKNNTNLIKLALKGFFICVLFLMANSASATLWSEIPPRILANGQFYSPYHGEIFAPGSNIRIYGTETIYYQYFTTTDTPQYCFADFFILPEGSTEETWGHRGDFQGTLIKNGNYYTCNFDGTVPISSDLAPGNYIAYAYIFWSNTVAGGGINFGKIGEHFVIGTPVVDNQPRLVFSADTTYVPANQATTLRWYSENTTSCTASGSWSGSKSISGSEQTELITSDKTYTLDCSGPNGSVQQVVNVYLLPAPVTTLKVNNKTGTVYVNINSKATLSWASTYTSSGAMTGRMWPCTFTGSIVTSSGVSGHNRVSSGSEFSKAITSPTSVSMTCYNIAGSDKKTVTIGISRPLSCSPPTQTVNTGATASFTASGGEGNPTWSAPGGSPSTGTGYTFNTSYSSAGTKTVTATSGTKTATCSVSVEAITAPTVTTPTATSITSTSATLGANVTSNGGAALSARGTCWGTSPNPSTNCLAAGGTAIGIFSHSRTGMPSNTLIYYRGYATNSAGTGYSASGSFTSVVAITAPTVTSPTATSITSTSATLGATVTSNGGANITARGTCWGTSTNPTTNCVAEGGTTVTTFTHSRTGLPSGILIYYRGYATNSAGTGYSASASFTTSVAITAPTVTTPTATSITSTSATLGANVTSNGGAALSARGTCWGTSPNPSTNCLAAGGTAIGIFSHSRTGMPSNTLIYYRGYATNSAGTGYSASGSFGSLADLKPDLIISIAPSLNSGTLTEGFNTTFKATVKNLETAQIAAPASISRFFVDLNNNGTLDTQIGDPINTEPLNTGNTDQVFSGTWVAVRGTHRIVICADDPASSAFGSSASDAGAIAELSETNNCSNYTGGGVQGTGIINVGQFQQF